MSAVDRYFAWLDRQIGKRTTRPKPALPRLAVLDCDACAPNADEWLQAKRVANLVSEDGQTAHIPYADRTGAPRRAL